MEKIKILVAEDIKATVRLYDKALNDRFFDKKFACDGQKALRYYQEWQPDIIVLDIQMPLMSGYSVLKKIREEFGDNKSTIIMATSLSSDDDINSCAAYGIQGYIAKPFKLKELEDQIMKGFSKKYPDIANTMMTMKRVENLS